MTTPNDQPLTEEELSICHSIIARAKQNRQKMMTLPSDIIASVFNQLANAEAELCRQKAKAERLAAMVEKFRFEAENSPRTADGVPVTVGDSVFHPSRGVGYIKYEEGWDEEGEADGWHAEFEEATPTANISHFVSIEECYSTRDALDLAHPTDSGGGLNLDAKENA